MGRVTDKRLIQELNDRAMAARAGIDYDTVSQSRGYQAAKKKYGSGFSGAGFGGSTGFKPGSIPDSIVQGIADMPMGISNAIIHGTTALGITGKPTQEYSDAMSKVRELQIEDSRAQQGREGFDFARLGGNMATPIPELKGLKALGGARGALARGAASGATAAAAMPVTGPGSGSYVQDKLSQATSGAIFGAGANYGLDKIAGLASKGKLPSVLEQRLDAGARQGIDMSLSEASPRYLTRAASDISSNLPGGRQLINQWDTTLDKFENRARDAATSIGTPRTKMELGQGVDRGLRSWLKTTKESADDLYNKVTRDVPMEAQVDMTPVRKAMVDTMEMFPSAPELGQSLANPTLAKWAQNITHSDGTAKPLFFNEAQRLRSEIGKRLGDPVISSDISRRELKMVYGALTDSMEKALTDAGATGALKTFRRAGQYHAARMKRIDNVIEPILRQNAEGMVNKIKSMLATDAKGTIALRRSMPKEEWDDVASTFFSELGKENPGFQNAEGQGFSVPKFLTDFNNLRKNEDAFNFAFGGTRYAPLREIYGDLATISNSIRQSKKIANFSRSGYTQGLIGMAGLLLTSPMTVVKAAIANTGFAKAMSSPRFARWMLKTGKIVNRGLSGSGQGAERLMQSHIERLPAIAAANSDIADGVNSIYGYFTGEGQ